MAKRELPEKKKRKAECSMDVQESTMRVTSLTLPGISEMKCYSDDQAGIWGMSYTTLANR